MLRLGSLALLGCAVALAGAAAEAAGPREALFRVTLSATLTKTWNFTEASEETACTRAMRGSGRWQTKLATRRARRVRAIDAGRGRVRFSEGVLRTLAGAAVQSGSITTSTDGPPPCQRLTRSERCRDDRWAFRRGSTTVTSPRRGVVRLERLRGAGGIRFRSRCEEEPTEINAARTDLPLATAPLAAADVFARDVPRFFASADTVQVTTLEGPVDGRIVERVRWTLVFRRLRG